MNISIVYATNTGNTYLAAQVIKEILGKDHQVKMVNALEAGPNDIENSDLIVLGSSSWDWQGKEGHPLLSMKDYLAKIENSSLGGRKFALFGCGDKDFRIFCGAVNHLDDFVNNHGGNQVIEPLRLDKFYIDILHKIELTKTWANELLSKIS